MPAPKNGAPRNPSETGCLRCGYAVYEAEKLIAAGRVRISISNLNSLTIPIRETRWLYILITLLF